MEDALNEFFSRLKLTAPKQRQIPNTIKHLPSSSSFFVLALSVSPKFFFLHVTYSLIMEAPALIGEWNSVLGKMRLCLLVSFLRVTRSSKDFLLFPLFLTKLFALATSSPERMSPRAAL